MTFISDIRHSCRQLARAPGYTVAVLLTLAFAIGATSAIFSAVNAVLLHRLPMNRVDRLVVAWQTDAARTAGVIELSHKQFREWQTESSVFTQTAAMGSTNWPAVLEGRGEPTKIWIAGVSAGFFETLGVAPMLGRTFEPADDVHRAAPVVIVSHATWVRWFGSDPAVIGSNVQFDGQVSQIIGVMPAGFDFPRGSEFWTPVAPVLAGSGPEPNQNVLDGVGLLYVVGRLRPDLDARGAARALDTFDERLKQNNRVSGPRATDIAVVTPFVDYVFGPVRPALWALAAAVGVLLLVACANVSALMLARVSLRRRELGVRLALGATRGSLGRQWAAEILVLAIAGGGLGLVTAHGLAKAIVAMAPDDLPRLADVAIDGTVAAFTGGIVMLVALVCGLFPVRNARATHVGDMLADGGRTTAGRQSVRARSSLLVFQIGLAVVLLVAAGLIVRSYDNLRRVDLGFVPGNVVTLDVQPRGTSMPANQWIDLLLQRVSARPGVEAAGAVYLRPLALGAIGQSVLVRLEGQGNTRADVQRNPLLNHQIATPGYFSAMRIPLLRGRLFDARDTDKAPRVMIVSQSTAARLWPGENPLGKRVGMSAFTPGVTGPQWRTVIGVVSDVRYRGLDQPLLDIYDAASQVGRPATNVIVRATSNPMALLSVVQAEARALDPGVIIDGVTSMDAVVARATAPWRMTTWLFVLFAGLAFGLAAVGLFGLVALDVVHRRREFAVRLAVGATPNAIVRLVLLGAGWRVFAGIAIGLLAAVGATRGVRSLLFGIQPLDPATYGAVIALVCVVVVVAAFVPARRAARVDPLSLLKGE